MCMYIACVCMTVKLHFFSVMAVSFSTYVRLKTFIRGKLIYDRQSARSYLVRFQLTNELHLALANGLNIPLGDFKSFLLLAILSIASPDVNKRKGVAETSFYPRDGILSLFTMFQSLMPLVLKQLLYQLIRPIRITGTYPYSHKNAVKPPMYILYIYTLHGIHYLYLCT